MFEDTLIGRRLDGYYLQELLGRGGMARVYRALDGRLKRWVAIKVIDRPFRTDKDYTRRFEQEAQSLAQLEHPHIVRVYRYDEADGLFYMVLQYVEGAPLDQVLATYRQEGELIEPVEASRINREICSALDYAHAKGVIHRDVKPSNIILNRQGNAILVDFGLALLADSGAGGEVFGTPQYIAPEQVRDSTRATPQSDLYAMGVILYEMFTGRLPFDGPDPLEVARRRLAEPPPSPREFRPELHHSIEAVILKALARDAPARYPTGLALANALDRALRVASGQGASTSPPTLSRLSIPERVGQEIGERALPPLPGAAASELPPELLETRPASAARWSRPAPIPEDGPMEPTRRVAGPAPAAPPQPAKRVWPVYVGAALVITLGLLLGFFLVRWLIGEAPLEVGQPPIIVEPPAPPPATATLAPAGPEPQLVADSRADFSSVGGGRWQYLVSEPDENDFESMEFGERVYGACWYAGEGFSEDYVRICPGSGHPGRHADVAWRWTSDFSGRVGVLVSAAKIDPGGDGVTVIAYHNGEVVQGLRLEPEDVQGVAGHPWFEVTVNEGDRLTFVLKQNEGAEFDHTAFQAQIYRE